MEQEDNSGNEQHQSRESYPSYGCHHRHRPRLSPKIAVATKEVIFKQAHNIVKQADKHEQFLNKVKYCFGVLGFGAVCYLMGSKPQEIPSLYCLFFMVVVPMRWIYYRSKKWHYYLLDFCYYANIIFMVMLLRFPKNEKLFMLCFSFSEGPLAWALIVWRCSLVFNHFDKIISVLIHLLPGTVIFILRWWDPVRFPHHSGPLPAASSVLWTWLFFVPLLVYCIWQALYFLIVEGLRRQRLMNDPEVMTSYRELKRKAERANNIWWRLSGLLGEKKRVIMYAIIQAAFTVATLALTVPLFRSYRLHVAFEIFKLLATVWNGGNFLLEVMPRQVIAQKRKKEDDDSKCGNPAVKGEPLGSTMILINKNGASIPADLSQLADFVLNDQVVCSLCKRSTMEIQLKNDEY